MGWRELVTRYNRLQERQSKRASEERYQASRQKGAMERSRMRGAH